MEDKKPFTKVQLMLIEEVGQSLDLAKKELEAKAQRFQEMINLIGKELGIPEKDMPHWRPSEDGKHLERWLKKK
jgi:hypothetical protein